MNCTARFDAMEYYRLVKAVVRAGYLSGLPHLTELHTDLGKGLRDYGNEDVLQYGVYGYSSLGLFTFTSQARKKISVTK